MKKRLIKNTNLEIAPINFGGNVFGWTLDQQQSFNILDNFVAQGFNFVDTANTYSWWADNDGIGGQSETIIGKWLRERQNRNQIVLATKVGSENKIHGKDISKATILKAANESLKRLQTDYIDLYYTHFDDEVTPVEETLSAYDELIKSGKVRYIAASNVSPERLSLSFEQAAKLNLPRYVALQPHYNLLVRKQFEEKYRPLVEQYNLNVFPYWSLEAGFLTGKYRQASDFYKTARGTGIKKYFDDRGKGILAALDKVAAKHQTELATVSLAWLLANPLVTAPIVSATNEKQLKTILDAPALKLDQEDLDNLNFKEYD